MAGVSTEQRAGGNKLEVDLNLVPFIDLLSTLVLFLLLTVVWIQVAVIPTTGDRKGQSESASADQIKLIVTLNQGHIDLSWPTRIQVKSLPKRVANLEQLLAAVKVALDGGAVFPASVRGDDHVEYGEVIRTLDQLKQSGVVDIAMGAD